MVDHNREDLVEIWDAIFGMIGQYSVAEATAGELADRVKVHKAILLEVLMHQVQRANVPYGGDGPIQLDPVSANEDAVRVLQKYGLLDREPYVNALLRKVGARAHGFYFNWRKLLNLEPSS
jgi:hypothetical protein